MKKTTLIIIILLLAVLLPVIPVRAAAEGDYIGVWDLNVLNDSPDGMATDGTNIWVGDWDDKTVYKYDMVGGYVGVWDLNVANADLESVTTDGSNIYVVDYGTCAVYKYNMAGGYIGTWDLDGANIDPYGITTDGTSIWVVEGFGTAVYKYNMIGDTIATWSLTGLNVDPEGITTDGTSIWVVDYEDDAVYKYDMDGGYIGVWDLNVLNDDASGITTDGTNIWVVDTDDDVVYKYLGPILPINIACDSDALFNRGESGWVNITVSDPQGVANIDSVDIQVNTMGAFESFTLRWTQGGAFTEQSDPDEICTLDAVNSTAINLNATAVRVCYHFTMTGGADGACAVKVTTTDDDANTDIDTYAAEFEFSFFNWDEEVSGRVDSAFSFFGILGFMDQAITFINSVGAHFTASLVNLAVLINLQFQVIWQVWGWATGWFTRMITAVLNFGNQLQMILNGTHPLLAGTVDLWNYFDFASAGQSVFDVAPVFFIIYWIDSMGKRARTQGGLSVLYNDLNAFANVFAYFMGAFSTLIGFIEGKISWLINAFIPG